MSELRIRPASPADRAAVDAVVSAAFGSHAAVVVPLVHELRRTGAAVTELVAVGPDGEGIVGHVVLSRGWVDAPARIVPVRVQSPLAVGPRWQRAGIGRALIEQAARSSEDAGMPAIFLEGDPAYYSRSGFRPAGRAGFRPPSHRIPLDAFQVRLLAAHEPWIAGSLVYPDAFWLLGAVGPG